jgi:hypothetical protein
VKTTKTIIPGLFLIPGMKFLMILWRRLQAVPPTAISCLSWNCRGLGNPLAVWDLRQLVKTKQPIFLFLMETKLQSNKLHALRSSMGYEGLFSIDPIGEKGGLALL